MSTINGTQSIPVMENGDILSKTDVIGISGNSRLKNINSRYIKQLSSIGKNKNLSNDKIIINENNVVEECIKYFKKHPSLGINPNQLKLHNVMSSGVVFTAVFFQTYQGIEIRNSLVRMHISPKGEILDFTSTYFDDIELKLSTDFTPIHPFQALKSNATIGLNEGEYNVIEDCFCIYPDFNGAGFDYKFAYDCSINIPGTALYKAYIDATTGEILQRTNLVKNADLTVISKHYGNNPNDPLVEGPLKMLTVNIEGVGDKITTGAGKFNPQLSDDVIGKNFSTQLSGTYIMMRERTYPDKQTQGVVYTYKGTITDQGFMLTDSNNRDEVFRTVYNNVFDARSYYISIDPGSIPSGGAGAFFCYVQMLPQSADLNSMGYEFNASAMGDQAMSFLCANHKKVFMGKLNKVVFHEYGHVIVAKKYKDAGKTKGMFSSLANEANADITTAFAINNPSIFENITTPDLIPYASNMGLDRTTDNNFTYPENISGESHHDSQILSGAF